MNAQLKTILLTVLTLSLFAIALVELSGVSSTALFNKYNIGSGDAHNHIPESEVQKKEKEAKALPRTTIQFDSTKHSFGKIKEGDVVKHAFKFKNTGKAPLLIYNAVASCGCTVPSYPKEPIQPGGEGEIIVQFNSKKRTGHQQKNVMIYSNTEGETTSIGFEADVE